MDSPSPSHSSSDSEKDEISSVGTRNSRKRPANFRQSNKARRKKSFLSSTTTGKSKPKKLNQKMKFSSTQCWDGFSFRSSYYVTVYRCPRNKGDIELVQCYQDDDGEEYFCCAWLYDPKSEIHFVAAGGERGIIRIIAPEKGDGVGVRHEFENRTLNYQVLKGHGKAVNDMRGHPTCHTVLVSAGRDRRVMVWHVPTSQCLLMVGGPSPHTDEVITADFDADGGRVVTGGMDHFIKVWDIKEKLEEQLQQVEECENRSLAPLDVNFPQVVTNEIHTNYIDCARFFMGDFIFSKSCEEQIILWKVGDEYAHEIEYHNTRPETNISLYRTLPLPESDVWFVKFALDPQYKILAAGDITGKIKIWPLGKNFLSSDEAKPRVLQHKYMRRCVRQVDFSPDGQYLIAVCDDASIWRWDKQAAGSTD